MGTLITRIILNRAERDGLISHETNLTIFDGFGDEVTKQLEALQDDPVFSQVAV